jgi:hypothetical protein
MANARFLVAVLAAAVPWVAGCRDETAPSASPDDRRDG